MGKYEFSMKILEVPSHCHVKTTVLKRNSDIWFTKREAVETYLETLELRSKNKWSKQIENPLVGVIDGNLKKSSPLKFIWIKSVNCKEKFPYRNVSFWLIVCGYFMVIHRTGFLCTRLLNQTEINLLTIWFDLPQICTLIFF